MQKTTYVNFDTGEGVLTYTKKAKRNIAFFAGLFANVNELPFQKPEGENKRLIEKICRLTALSQPEVEMINYGDELLNAEGRLLENFGCTAIAKNKSVGQTLDFFTVDLTLVREKDCLYVTMPPYLALLGMNQNLAFCTNYLPGSVAPGVPISQLRRNILRYNSIDEVIQYFNSIPRATAANFLLLDGKNIVDIEVSLEEVKTYDGLCHRSGSYFAHTNHFLQTDIREDRSCSRLDNAVKLLQEKQELSDILGNSGVRMPVTLSGSVGFGSIITVIMEPLTGKLRYKDLLMDRFEELLI